LKQGENDNSKIRDEQENQTAEISP
jgi:hypothetical protein